MIGSGAVAWPLAAHAQQARMPVIGYLSGWSPGDAPEYLTYFRRGLAETGYTEGRNVAFEFRFAEGQLKPTRRFGSTTTLSAKRGPKGTGCWKKNGPKV